MERGLIRLRLLGEDDDADRPIASTAVARFARGRLTRADRPGVIAMKGVGRELVPLQSGLETAARPKRARDRHPDAEE